MDERHLRRIAHNESRFRELNQRIRRGYDDIDPATEHYSVLCECAITECEDMIDISRPDYDQGAF